MGESEGVKLVEPAWLSDGSVCYVLAGRMRGVEADAYEALSGNPPPDVWRPGVVTCAAGDRARVLTKTDDGRPVEVWRRLRALRVRAPASPGGTAPA